MDRSGAASASGRTVAAAVQAAAATLGLQPDQVDIEVLEDAVPSSFGVIGSPAIVSVRPKATLSVVTPPPSEVDPPQPGGGNSPQPLGALTEVGEAPAPRQPAPASEEPFAPVTEPPPPPSRDHPTAPVTELPRVPPQDQSAPPATLSAVDSGVEDGNQAAPSSSASHEPAARAPRTTSSGELAGEADGERDAEAAADFVEGLLDVLDLEADITTWIDEAGGHVDVRGPDLAVLVGRDGETLAALQDLMWAAVIRQTHHRPRVLLDIDGFREQRRQQLVAEVRSVAQRVNDTGVEETLRPMSAFERKVAHDVAAGEGLVTESVGIEPDRRVVFRRA